MRVPTSSRRSRVGFNMTPMIDVVFLLIIFFLVSSHLARQETHVELDLPEARTGIDERSTPAPRVTLNLMPDGRILWGARPVSLEELRRRLQTRRATAEQPLIVRIRGDRNVAYRTIEPILRHCAEAGVAEVAFAVLPPKGR